MFTKWQQVEDWIRDNGLTSWRFTYDRTGIQPTDDGGEKQTRSNRVCILSDAFPGELEEKIALTRRRLFAENNQVLYGYGKRGKENTGMLYCEVRLVDDFQQPGAQPVSSPFPAMPAFDKDEFAAQIRKEVMMEIENQRYKDERKQFELDKKEFEEEKKSAIGLLVHHLSPILSNMTQKRVTGVDSAAPVVAQPIHAVETEEIVDEVFDAKESDRLFELMAEFKAVEPRYLELIEKVVQMAKNGDQNYEFAKKMLLG